MAAPTKPVPAGLPAPVWLVGAFLLVSQFVLGLSFIRSAAPTYDEPVHLASGYSYLATGRYRMNILDHPPLAEMWAALPLLRMGPSAFLSHPDYLGRRVYHYADNFLYRNGVSPERMMNAGRAFAFLTWSGLLALGLAFWAHRLGGAPAALGALAAAAFCPVLLSNLALVTTDGASAALFFTVFWLLSHERRTARRWALAGAAAGLALASKFNMILLGPLVAGGLIAEHLLRPKPRPRLPLGGAACAALAALAALALVYRLGQLPLYWEGLTATLTRLDEGRSSFLRGRYSTTGFALYFPAALAVKTPIPILALSFGMIAYWAADRRRLAAALWVLVPLAGYFLAALTAKVQIGVRHLLPMFPFLALAAGCGAGKLWETGKAGKAAVLVLGGWLAGSVIRASPYLLGYFNEAAGGPAGGYRWLVDSNLDWGQDLKALAEDLKGLGNPPVYLSYFGVADPAFYGVRYVPVAYGIHVDRPGDDVSPAESGRVLFAVSATNLQCAYFADKTLFDWLKTRAPIAVPGHSIFLYDLTADAEGRRRLEQLVRLSGNPPARAKGLLVQ